MAETRDKHAKIRFGRRSIRVPGSKRQRVILGTGLIVGGIVGFLPVVGFWMLPLGLAVLSVDSPRARRLRRQLELRWSRRHGSKQSGKRKGRE